MAISMTSATGLVRAAGLLPVLLILFTAMASSQQPPEPAATLVATATAMVEPTPSIPAATPSADARTTATTPISTSTPEVVPADSTAIRQSESDGFSDDSADYTNEQISAIVQEELALFVANVLSDDPDLDELMARRTQVYRPDVDGAPDQYEGLRELFSSVNVELKVIGVERIEHDLAWVTIDVTMDGSPIPRFLSLVLYVFEEGHWREAHCPAGRATYLSIANSGAVIIGEPVEVSESFSSPSFVFTVLTAPAAVDDSIFHLPVRVTANTGQMQPARLSVGGFLSTQPHADDGVAIWTTEGRGSGCPGGFYDNAAGVRLDHGQSLDGYICFGPDPSGYNQTVPADPFVRLELWLLLSDEAPRYTVVDLTRSAVSP